jgi:hypothetical protein
MPMLVIFIAAALFAAALCVFRYTAPSGGEFWYEHSWQSLLSHGALLVLLLAVAVFVVQSVFVIRRASSGVWFFALAVSSLPTLAALWPVAVELDIARHSEQYLDAGGDVPYLISTAERIFGLSLSLSVVLALMATYGYLSRTKA